MPRSTALACLGLWLRLASALQLPPGPRELAGLGSIDLLWRLYAQHQPLPDVLQQYRREYGDIFTVKTGPIRQVWVLHTPPAPFSCTPPPSGFSSVGSGRAQLSPMSCLPTTRQFTHQRPTNLPTELQGDSNPRP